MARKKLAADLKKKEKASMTTFEKRKANLFKKAKELSILCEVQSCVIICGPKQDDGSIKLDIGCQGIDYVRDSVNKYKSSCKPKICSKFDFPVSERSKNNPEIGQLRVQLGKDDEYPSWDDRINNFSRYQLRKLAAQMEAKLEVVNRKINMKRGNHDVMEGSKGMEDDSKSSQTISDFTKDYLKKKEDMEESHQQPVFNVNPLDVQHPVHYQPLQGMVNFKDFVETSMMKNYENCPQFGVMPPNNIQHTPLTRMFNNAHPLMSYYMPTMHPMHPHMQYRTMPSGVVMPPHMQHAMMPPHYMQYMPPHMQFAPMSSASSHMPASPAKFHDIHRFYMKNDNASN